jgi:gliding motility-associated-like protein
MKKHYLLVLAILMLCCSKSSMAQWVGTNVYLQGKYVEIGMTPNASFGTCNPQGAIPAGYHPHMCFGCSGIPPMGTNLAEVYDYGHDGWATGAPAYMGDYTYPGSPFEGWELQIGTGRVQAFQNCTGTMWTGGAGMAMAGANAGYSNAAGRAIGVWTGTATYTGGVALSVRQQTRVDTMASCVVVTTVLKNTSAVVAPNVYYHRSCDPDNDQTWSGGGFPTNNTIVHQNQDATHRVLVSSVGMGYPASSYMALGTKDCRAKCFIYNSWSISSTVDLATTWTGTYPAVYALGATSPGDIAIGLTYNIGNIPAGDSAIVSYAYIWNGNTGIDSAFPDPQLVINGIKKPVVPVPHANYDTFDACGTGLTTIPVSLLYADDKSWSWSKWTWSTGIGLASTTGVTNTINLTVIPGIYTYTITGTDSAAGMGSCLKKTFYLTIKTCNFATASTPCVGDSLKFNRPGDSSGATYAWSGPAPSTTVFATTQKAFKYPATLADAGTYRVIRTLLGIPDTAYIIANVNPLPVISGVFSLCQGTSTTLSSSIAGGTWSSSNGAVASIGSSNGVVNALSVGNTTITYIAPTGCLTTQVINVFQLSPITGIKQVCMGATTTLFDSVAGGTWSSSTPTIATVGTSGIVTGINGIVGSGAFGTATITYTAGGCQTTTTVTVHPIKAILGVTDMCQYFTTTLSNALPHGTWASSSPGIASITSLDSTRAVVYGASGGTATITYTTPVTFCRSTVVVTVHPKPAPPVVSNRTHCQFEISVPPLVATLLTGHSATWYGPYVTAGISAPPTPYVDTAKDLHYYVKQTSPFGCVSDSAHIIVTIIPKPAPPTTQDLVYCQFATVPALTAGGSNLKWYTSLTGGTALSAPPVPPTTTVGTTSWYVSQTVAGCESDRTEIKVTIMFKPVFTISASNTKVCQHDSLTFWYTGASLVNGTFNWELPIGATAVNGTSLTDSLIVVRFDTSWGDHIIKLTVGNNGGECLTTEQIKVNVIPQPAAYAFTPHDICLGDSVSLALTGRTDNAETFAWFIDGVPMASSTAVSIVTANSNTGGPFRISWNDTGRHIITVQTFSKNACPSKTTHDTVNVHPLPSAWFRYELLPGKKNKICIDDSIQFFAADSNHYNNSYRWEPDHSFNNINNRVVFGRVEQLKSFITLTVTTPFGCKATSTQLINTQPCCSVWFPTAFSPNADGKNDHFKPVFSGYHRFHTFRVTNRWGQVVYETTNSDGRWDGTMNGVPQDMGVYFYYIKYDCGGQTLEDKGDCTLVR